MKLRQTLSNHRGAVIGLGIGIAAACAVAFLIAKPLHEEIKSLEAKRDSARAEVVAMNGGKEPTYRSCALLSTPAAERENCIKAMDEFVAAGQQVEDKTSHPPFPTFYALISAVGAFIGNNRDVKRRLRGEQPTGDPQ